MIVIDILLIVILFVAIYYIICTLRNNTITEQLINSISHSHLNDTKLNDLFVFLWKENCLEDFILNYNETHKTNPKNELHSITQYTNKVKKQDYISLAFTWDKTNHGFHFWNKINKKSNDTLNVQHSTDIFELINYVKSLNL